MWCELFGCNNKPVTFSYLKMVANNTMSPEEKMIFARFANATWKVGQPFRVQEELPALRLLLFIF
jgi:hypothetical protein